MTNTMYLERKSNLVMPSHYVELDKEEMSYVDGGFYLNKSIVNEIMVCIQGVLGVTLGGITWAGIKASLKLIATAIAKKSILLGVLGFAAAFVVVVLACYAYTFLYGVYNAFQKGTGVSMDWGLFNGFHNYKYY